MKFLLISVLLLVVISSAQQMKVWKTWYMLDYFVMSEVDSLTFETNLQFNIVLDSMVDSRDNKVYKTVTIGTQTWMAENLNYGSSIHDGYSSQVFQEGAQKFCFNNGYCENRGGMYQWHTAMGFSKECSDGTKKCSDQIDPGNHVGICPVDWHIPKSSEWDMLKLHLKENLGVEVGKYLKDPKFGGTNESNFSAVSTGFRDRDGGGGILQARRHIFGRLGKGIVLVLQVLLN